MDGVLKMLMSVSDRLAKLEEAQTEESIQSLIARKVEEKVNLAFEEAQERERRKNNIIVENVPEPRQYSRRTRGR